MNINVLMILILGCGVKGPPQWSQETQLPSWENKYTQPPVVLQVQNKLQTLEKLFSKNANCAPKYEKYQEYINTRNKYLDLTKSYSLNISLYPPPPKTLTPCP